MRIQIPTYEEAKEKAHPTPLDIFVLNNEPAGVEDEMKFRKELQDLIEWVATTIELAAMLNRGAVKGNPIKGDL